MTQNDEIADFDSIHGLQILLALTRAIDKRRESASYTDPEHDADTLFAAFCKTKRMALLDKSHCSCKPEIPGHGRLDKKSRILYLATRNFSQIKRIDSPSSFHAWLPWTNSEGNSK